MSYYGRISLLLPKLPKLPSQCYFNTPGISGKLGSNKENFFIAAQIAQVVQATVFQ